MTKATLIRGDTLTALPALRSGSAHALITDPPAGIGFMGKAWDRDKGGRDQWIAWLASVLSEARRVLKPGGHGLVWALPRTSHWTGISCEDAGFQVRDRVAHLFGSGFPKSLDLGKAIEGEEWHGWGTALKPACEDWWLVRKPFRGSVASNVLKHGTGGINVDGGRVGTGVTSRTNTAEMGYHGGNLAESYETGSTSGRWPANVVLSCYCASDEHEPDCAVRELDRQSGNLTSGDAPNGLKRNSDKYRNTFAAFPGMQAEPGQLYADSGGASRFFYCAKPSRAEREAGLQGLPRQSAGAVTNRKDGSAGLDSPRAGAGRTSGARNYHPTVKSIALMRYLIRLITPPGGTVLDPFMGSGTTGIACVDLGMDFIGIEQAPDYYEIAKRRIHHAAPLIVEIEEVAA